jgi:hypothetical protein
MQRRILRVGCAGALVAAFALAVPAFAASGVSAVRVAGVQSPADSTAGKPGDLCRAVDPMTGAVPAVSNTMAGSLVGCWYTDTFSQIKSAPNGNILAIGTEHFVGCIDADRSGRCAGRDPRGTLALIYVFEAQYDKKGNEIHGGCQHVIVSGTGKLAQARGRIDFTDKPANGSASYRGSVMLAGRATQARATSASRSAAC